ncbi:MAG: folate-binding protein YgfZ [Gammaproteobacteria bacterium]|nr:folate-binding protein YgfZ [Gammaproteobacteria bacterium]
MSTSKPWNEAQAASLRHLQLLRVAGAGRQAFLQSQLTQDLRRLETGLALRYAWADARGRVLLAGEVFSWREALWLTVPAALARAIRDRLHLFVLRAEVTVELADIRLAGRLLHDEAPVLVHGLALPAQPLGLGAAAAWCMLRTHADQLLVCTTDDAILAESALPGSALDDTAWRLGDIRAGFARIDAETGSHTPQMLNLDLSGAVSLDKGCYPGQEIITRTRHLGRLKRRLFRYAGPCPPPAAGATVFDAGGGEAGAIIMAAAASAGSEMLAVVSLEATGGALFTDPERRQRLQPLDLPYSVP